MKRAESAVGRILTLRPYTEKQSLQRRHRQARGRRPDIAFYRRLLAALSSSDIPFMVGGAFALRLYTNVKRDTKDLDVFCRPGAFHRLMNHLRAAGFHTSVVDQRWLGKAYLTDGGEHYADVIFGTASGTPHVADDWIERARPAELFGLKVKVLAPEELIFCKAYVQDRERYDGADVNHLILKTGRRLDWRRLLNHMDRHWELLFSVLLNFVFVYPTERDVVPRWLFEELISRLLDASELSYKPDQISRGHLLSRTQYKVDARWGFKTIS